MNTPSTEGQASDEPRRCSECGSVYSRPDWTALRVHDVLLPEQLRAFITHWPLGASIEVRVCQRCAKPIARIRREP
jgi:uncharacterized protein with PIN domain